MDSKTKHRILGLLVMAALFVIITPVFHQHKIGLMDNPLNEIPPFPDQSVQLSSLDNDVSAALPSQPVKAAAEDKAAPIVAPASGWVIQLGSFKNKMNALRLVNQLRAEGYRAFLGTNHAVLTRVFVGPENKKTDASLLAEQLNRKTHLQGVIINYHSLTL